MTPRPRRPPRRSGGQPHISSYVRERAALEGGTRQRIQDELAARGLSPRKRFGQNFLIRDDLAERIVDHAHLREDDVVVEIGPGTGALTAHIARRVAYVTAVEKDTGLVEFLREELVELSKIEIVEGDFLEFDIAATARAHGVEKVVVLGNVPYYITTPILERLFEQKHAVRSAVLLVQKEYAERLAAAADTPEYGSLTLFARWHTLMEPLMTIKASAFWPRPEVDSMLVRFLMRDKPPVEVPDEGLLFRLIRGAFHMRRKQLVNTVEETLGLGKDKIDRLLRQVRIDPRRRGETLTLEEFARLAREAATRLENDDAR